MCISMVVKFFLLASLLWGGAFFTQVSCFGFNFTSISDDSNLILSNNSSVFQAIQVTPDVGSLPMTNKSGRAFYNRRFRLWKKRGVNAVFNSSFTLHIKNQTATAGEGLAFVLTDSTGVPENSDGQWLSIVNATTNGTSQANIVAIEFDTRKSYSQDLDGNHVGLDINSIYSIKQVSLNSSGVKLSTGTIVTVHVQYDGKNITVSVGHNAENLDLVLSYPIDLSEFLPQKVFVGFTASTSIYTQTNCVKSWEFNGSDFDEGLKFWVWIVVAAAVVVLLSSGVAFYFYRKKRNNTEDVEDTYPSIEEQIQSTTQAPRKFFPGKHPHHRCQSKGLLSCGLPCLHLSMGRIILLPEANLLHFQIFLPDKIILYGEELKGGQQCLPIDYASDKSNLILSNNSGVFLEDSLQVTADVGSLPITNKSGRAFYNRPFRLWKKRGVNAVFNSSFTLNIKNQTATAGEGLAFVLTDNTDVQENSYGQWLGIVNATTNGTSQANIVAIEFDTRKSYSQDLDGNHVGLDINSIYSIKQVSLNSSGVKLSTGTIVTVHVQYDGKNITVSVGHNAENLDLVLSYPIDLSEFLPQKVFVGFTASTSIYTQTNCVKSWEFNGSDFDEGLKFWGWIVVAAAVVLSGEAPPPQVPIERPSFVWPAMPPSFSGSDHSLTGSQLTPFSDISAR
ncbi:hypothetical protein EZV62_015799 [Acer yangbiense]|uniref:Legume lectin domain-containing protein n=1 Tax=Acer yangbiense TaxID=1000413 RepID=A0A5C7HLU2_9ROSI|nr:hypothetical protein EZV62_015799 [Acer yangbiense]